MIPLLLTAAICNAQNMGSMTDPRDGQEYKTVTYEDVSGSKITWMAENLNYYTSGSYADGTNENYQKSFGLLYSWGAAKEGCPIGWHLPSNKEWQVLIDLHGGDDVASKELKSTQGWKKEGNGTNSSGFNALPGGTRSAFGFEQVGQRGSYWSSSAWDDKSAWERNFWTGKDKVYSNHYDRSQGVWGSVRCLQN